MRLFLLPIFALAACGSPEAQNQTVPDQPPRQGPKAEVRLGLDRSHAGEPVPETAFEDPDGEPASLADFRGKPLLVNLWATWCAPCVAEMPTLDALAGREGKRLQVVTISQDPDGRAGVEAFFDKQGYRNLETWLDPKMALMPALKVDTLPTTILYDAQGRELWRWTGGEDWGSADAARLLAESVKK
jgi:thiol-disulfide isomerase/thioredoxin